MENPLSSKGYMHKVSLTLPLIVENNNMHNFYGY